MINDRFNGGSGNEFKGRFRDRKFVSTVAIGIFLLILLIVLVAKGCGSRKPRPTQGPTQVQPQGQQIETPAPPEEEFAGVAAPRQEVEEDEGRRLLREGQEYYNGDGGRAQNYVEAEKCFLEAKKLGVKDADVWLKKCGKKLAPPAPPKPVKAAPKKPAKAAPKKPVKAAPKAPARNVKKKK